MKRRRPRAERECDVRVDPGLPLLPVAGSGSLARVRKSRRGPWRATVLAGVHLLIAAHVTHFLIAGRTLSPVEPSEAMYTLELGWVNAGFIFFGVALVSTLLFGRFFCGWGCHLVALQDLCGWLMKKAGIRPRPFRSRLLVYAPLVLALYMFVYPTLRRKLWGDPADPFPGFSNHLMTTGFWDTFPGPVFAVLTFVTCGFLAVYLLGAKGFCTYGCPYGAFFGIADRLSPGRILVGDACDQCGHCTVTCTSNVRVHDEVRRFGMVVDPGCMKCTDCVSVCPKGALRFGFSTPSLLRPRTGERGTRRYSLSWPAEILAAVVTLVATLTFRGLYDGPPLLMSLALGGITAFLSVKLFSLAKRPPVRLQTAELKASGRLTIAGKVFAALVVTWLLFTAHSSFIQWHRSWGRYHLNRAEAAWSTAPGAHDSRHLEAMLYHFGLADRWGLVHVAEVELGMAWGHFLRAGLLVQNGARHEAVQSYRACLELAPDSPQARYNLGGLLRRMERFAEAIEQLEYARRLTPDDVDTHVELGLAYAGAGRERDAIVLLRRAIELDPQRPEARYSLPALIRELELRVDSAQSSPAAPPN